MECNDILAAREDRRYMVLRIAEDSNVVTVKTNTPGVDKNLPEALLCTAYFARLAEKMGAVDLEHCDGADGRCYIGKIEDADAYKIETSRLEDMHEIGRFIDIDVTRVGADHSISSGRLRRCYLCGEPAFVCARKRAHTTSDLLLRFKKEINDYFLTMISDMVYSAMMTELCLTDKFGLVSPVSRGSHTDLSYGNMCLAAGEITGELATCFNVGLTASEVGSLLPDLRPIGVACEAKMLEATGGANAYKGFIFVGGALLAAAGYVLGHGLSYDEIYTVAAKICSDIKNDMPTDTFGHKAYVKYGFGGIRKEAALGFPTVKYAEELIPAEPTDDELRSVLVAIVKRAEDSVLLKRAGNLARYEYYKRLITESNLTSRDELKRINEICVSENISIGGSADILIAAVLMREIKNNFKF